MQVPFAGETTFQRSSSRHNTATEVSDSIGQTTCHRSTFRRKTSAEECDLIERAIDQLMPPQKSTRPRTNRQEQLGP
jgi:hypothetical protein